MGDVKKGPRGGSSSGIHKRRAFSDHGSPPKDTGKTHTTIYNERGRRSFDIQGGKITNDHPTKNDRRYESEG
jgi:hypothetical protein